MSSLDNIPETDYLTLKLNFSGNIKTYHFSLHRVRSIIVNNNNIYYHIGTNFLGPFANFQFTNGSLKRLQEMGIKIFTNNNDIYDLN